MFARVLVEVKLEHTLLDVIFFENERGIIMEQRIEYEWRPLLCSECKNCGHTVDNYRATHNKRWAPKAQQQ